MPTAIWPIMPARITFADTHSAKERKKKKEIIIKISTTEHSQQGGFHSAVSKGNIRVSNILPGSWYGRKPPAIVQLDIEVEVRLINQIGYCQGFKASLVPSRALTNIWVYSDPWWTVWLGLTGRQRQPNRSGWNTYVVITVLVWS